MQPIMKATLQLPAVLDHPNRVPFRGCLTRIGVVSDKAPSGAQGHRVILTREAAVDALPSLLGMAVSFRVGWDGHDARQKCGVITSVTLDGECLAVEGYVYSRDFPEIATAGEHRKLGMSYELADAHVEDMRAKVWVLTRATFTGAAILLRDKAAYRQTSFEWLGAKGPTEPRPDGAQLPSVVALDTFALCAARESIPKGTSEA